MNPKLSFLTAALFFQAFLISCNTYNSKKYSVPVQKDSTAGSIMVSNTIKVNIDTIPVISGKQITGTWEDLGKEPLTVDITKNTIAYREHHETHHFKIKADSIYIYYPGMILPGRPYLIKDTFVIAMVNGEDKYVRLKK